MRNPSNLISFACALALAGLLTLLMSSVKAADLCSWHEGIEGPSKHSIVLSAPTRRAMLDAEA